MECLQNAKYMKQVILTLVCLLLIGSIAPTFATASDADPCENLELKVTIYGDTAMFCYFSPIDNIAVTILSADDVWITNEEGSLVLTCHAPLGNRIDISSLENGTYIVHAQRGGCIMEKSMFISCAEYRHINLSVSNTGDTIVRYDISNNGTIAPPHVDSVWITENKDAVVFTGHVQSGEPIDVSSFQNGTYYLWIQIGDCVMSKSMLLSPQSPCRYYRHINLTTKVNDDHSAMYYDLSNSGTTTPPHVDSVWITKNYLNGSIVLVSYVQSGEWTDISSLKIGVYYLHVQIGDCVMRSQRFIIRDKEVTPPDPCEAYSNVTIAVTVAEDYSTIRYDLADEGMPTALAVDSIWITNNAVSPVVLTGHAQPGEPIDISFLRKGLYVLWVQIDGCVKEGPQFRIDRISTDLDSPADSETAVKILHNGQLLILRNNKVYTLQGVETRL